MKGFCQHETQEISKLWMLMVPEVIVSTNVSYFPDMENDMYQVGNYSVVHVHYCSNFNFTCENYRQNFVVEFPPTLSRNRVQAGHLRQVGVAGGRILGLSQQRDIPVASAVWLLLAGTWAVGTWDATRCFWPAAIESQSTRVGGRGRYGGVLVHPWKPVWSGWGARLFSTVFDNLGSLWGTPRGMQECPQPAHLNQCRQPVCASLPKDKHVYCPLLI